MAAKSKLWLMYLIVFCANLGGDSAEEIKELKQWFYYDEPSKTLKCKNEALTVEIGSRVRIYMNITTPTIDLKAKCKKSFSSEKYEEVSLIKQNERYGYTLDPFSEILTKTGKWDYTCVFYRYNCVFDAEMQCGYRIVQNGVYTGLYKDEGIPCVATINVKVPQNIPYYLLTAGEYFTRVNQEYIYRFHEGEGTNFTCFLNVGNLLSLSYNSRAGTLSTEFKRANSVSMFTKLEAANNDTTLECSFYDLLSNVQLISLRLILAKDRRGITFEVNGSTFPYVAKIGNIYCYEYMYYEREELSVAVVKDDRVYGYIICDVLGTNVPVKLKRSFSETVSQGNVFKFTTDFESDTFDLLCTVAERENSYHFVYIHFKFIMSIPSYSPYIYGLSMSNILLQYTKGDSNMVEYNMGAGPLSLHCEVHSSTTQMIRHSWSFAAEMFPLQPQHNFYEIQCTEKFPKIKTTILKLFRRNDPAIHPIIQVPDTSQLMTLQTTLGNRPTISTTTRTPFLSPTTLSMTQTTLPTSQNTLQTTAPTVLLTTTVPGASRNPFSEGWWFWTIVVIVMLLVLLAAIGLWKAFNFKKTRLLDINDYYQNLPGHQNPMTTPFESNRPNNEIYASSNSIENVHANSIHKNNTTKIKPIPQPRKNIGEPTYLNIHPIANEAANADQNSEATYASVQNSEPTYASAQKSEPTYANQNAIENQTKNVFKENAYAVVNKNTSKAKQTETPNTSNTDTETNNSSQNENNIVYAMIYHKNSTDNNIKKVELPVYSEIVPQKPYANDNDLKNDNKFTNAEVKDDVEPAYCEVIKVKK